ncbi:hypothetical protein BaRGS_00024381, partial [Batillaria attramentaria]
DHSGHRDTALGAENDHPFLEGRGQAEEDGGGAPSREIERSREEEAAEEQGRKEGGEKAENGRGTSATEEEDRLALSNPNILKALK